MSTPASRTVLVTGCGSATGIGFAIARAFGRLGHPLVITATTARIDDRVAELCAEGIVARGWAGDLTEEVEVARLAVAAGEVAILVNNAGMAALGALDPTAPLEEMALGDWRRSLDRNLTTAFLVTRACLPAMKARRWGRVIHVASTTGPVGGIAFDCAYAAAKAGMAGMMRSLCLEVAAYGVTVNAIAPGWIATGSQTGAEAAAGAATPLGRSGTPAEVAACATFLGSEGAAYVTGQLLIVDGGNAVLEMHR